MRRQKNIRLSEAEKELLMEIKDRHFERSTPYGVVIRDALRTHDRVNSDDGGSWLE